MHRPFRIAKRPIRAVYKGDSGYKIAAGMDARLVEAMLAIVQLKQGETMTADEVMAFTATRLARYKVPRRVIFDPVMRNPTGKLMKPQMREKYTGRHEAFHQLDKG